MKTCNESQSNMWYKGDSDDNMDPFFIYNANMPKKAFQMIVWVIYACPTIARAASFKLYYCIMYNGIQE